MKISQEYIGIDNYEVLEIVSANYLGDYSVKVVFNDSNTRKIDFRPFLEKSQHPSISKYLDENLFSNFEIKHGNLNWNDYDLIFPLEDLHQGKIS